MDKLTTRIFKGDKIIWGIIIFLSLISLLAVYSSTGSLAFKYQGGNMFYYLFRHGVILFIGFVLIIVFQNIPIVVYNRLAFLFILITIPLLFYTLLKGTSLNEASRWITLPGTGISFQTSDFAKFSLIVYLARFLARNQNFNSEKFESEFRFTMLIILLICGLILPANFSTAALLFVTTIFLLFLGKIPFKYIFRLVLVGIIITSVFVSIALIFFPQTARVTTWKKRIESYFDGTKTSSDANYQVEQAKIAIASGGLIGKGPGNSTQRNLIPHPYSDFIFAIIIEEYGFIGAVFVILAYLILFYRAGIIVRKSQTTFPAFLSVGLLLSLVLQAMVNMGVSVNIFPVTGQPLPLVSMGGTSIIFTSLSMGIILNISILNKVEEENLEKNDLNNKEKQQVSSEENINKTENL